MAKAKKNSFQEAESSYQQYVNAKFKSDQHTKRLVITACIISVITVILMIFSVFFYFHFWVRNAQIGNVSVGGISLQGLTAQEATALLKENKNELLVKHDILVKIFDDIYVMTVEDSNAQLNITAMVDAAFSLGHDNDTELDPQNFMFMDTSRVRVWLQSIIQPYNGKPEQTSITVAGERPDLTKKPVSGEPNQILTVKIGTPKKYCPPEPLFERILNAYKNRTYEIVAETEIVDPDPVTADSIFAKYCVRPVNATINPETLVITEGIYGYGFDTKEVQNKLNAAQWGDTITIPLERIKPNITSDTLNAALFVIHNPYIVYYKNGLL